MHACMYKHMNFKNLYYVITVTKVTWYACAELASHGGSALAVLRIASCGSVRVVYYCYCEYN